MSRIEDIFKSKVLYCKNSHKRETGIKIADYTEGKTYKCYSTISGGLGGFSMYSKRVLNIETEYGNYITLNEDNSAHMFYLLKNFSTIPEHRKSIISGLL